MSMEVRPTHVHPSFAKPHSIREKIRNFLLRRGFFHKSPGDSPSRENFMSSTTHTRRHTFSMPKDYLRRRRVFRKTTNIVLVLVLSLCAGYVITRPTGGTGFSLPKSQMKRELPPPVPVSPPGIPVAVSSSSASVPGSIDGYHLQPGPLTVSETNDIVLHDAKRNKDVHMRLFFPDAPGKYPVIVFSHGASGSQNCCELLTKHWAGYGYVTIQPTHDDSAVQRRNSGEENITFPQALRDALKNPALWESRPQDISFILDSLPELQKRIPALTGKIDATRIGVGGHSMGAYTSEAIAGARIDLPDHPATDFSDPRVKAVLALSPQGPHQFGLTDQSFQTISIPFLGVTGSLDSLGPVSSPAWHKIPFDRSQPGDKYHLFLAGAAHSSFVSPEAPSRLVARGVGLPSSSQAQAIFDYTNSASLAFWDAYLKNDATAKQYLQSDTLTDSSHGAAQLSHR